MEIELIKCKRTDAIYQDIRNRHYVANKGTHGQQMHYKISVDNEIVGIISGASSVWAVKARDNFFGLTKENKRKRNTRCLIKNMLHKNKSVSKSSI